MRVCGDRQHGAKQRVKPLEISSEAVLQPLRRLLREHIVARGRIGRGKHGFGNLEDFILVAGSRFYESGLELHHVQPIEYIEAIVTVRGGAQRRCSNSSLAVIRWRKLG